MGNKSLDTFKFLESHAHRISDDYADRLPLTEEIKNKNNDAQYWLFSDLYNLFGYYYMGQHNNIIDTIGSTIRFSDFQKLPKKNSDNIFKAPNFYKFYSGHVVSIINNYDIQNPNGTITKKNGADARLSRYACWSLFKQWPKMIFAQLYFMMPDISFNDLYNAAYKYSRIYHRTELMQTEKKLNGIAYKNHADMRQFNGAMHRAFFYTSDIEKLKTIYGISGTIFDYMGAQSLMARSYAQNKAINIYDQNPYISFDRFISILYDELVAARVKMIQRTGHTPEKDICKKSVSAISSDLKKLEHDFIKKFAFQNLR